MTKTLFLSPPRLDGGNILTVVILDENTGGLEIENTFIIERPEQ